LQIDYNRCKKVVKILNNYFKNSEGLADVEYPKNIKYKSNEYYLYMFYSCLLDYGMRSKIYHNNLIETYKKYPNIFQPSCVCDMLESDLYNIIVNNIHPRYPNVAVKKWITLSEKLNKYDCLIDYLKKLLVLKN